MTDVGRIRNAEKRMQFAVLTAIWSGTPWQLESDLNGEYGQSETVSELAKIFATFAAVAASGQSRGRVGGSSIR